MYSLRCVIECFIHKCRTKPAFYPEDISRGRRGPGSEKCISMQHVLVVVVVVVPDATFCLLFLRARTTTACLYSLSLSEWTSWSFLSVGVICLCMYQQHCVRIQKIIYSVVELLNLCECSYKNVLSNVAKIFKIFLLLYSRNCVIIRDVQNFENRKSKQMSESMLLCTLIINNLCLRRQ